jgi:ubiquinone/menaquinone biosynthesis C-methylase UbiE
MNDALIKKISELHKKNSDKNWLNSLEERKIEEANFHDLSHHEEISYENKKWYTTVEASRDYLQNWIKSNSKGKIVLDYACGNGEMSIVAANAGASLVIGIDISPISIQNAQKLAIKNNLQDKCFFFQGDCENTELPDNSIETAFCFGVLHHMELNNVYPELERILKPQGKILAGEALNYNPVIRWYRMRTPEMRTEWEKHHILSLKDVDLAKEFFKVGEVRFWHITSFLTAFFRKIPFLMKLALVFCNFIDSILTKIPFIQLMAWQFTFELIKKEK